MQPELARLSELADAGAEGEERVARDGGCEIGERAAHVVDARILDAEDVWIVRVGDEMLEGLARVVGELFEEGFCFGLC